MTSPITLFRDQIVTTWEAITPPSKDAVRYREVDGRSPRKGATSSDRSFSFSMPVREEPVGQFGPAVTHVRWTVSATVTISQTGRSLSALFDACAHESNLLARAIEMSSVWPSGVIEVVQQPVDVDRDSDSGDAYLVFEWSVLTAETD